MIVVRQQQTPEIISWQ